MWFGHDVNTMLSSIFISIVFLLFYFLPTIAAYQRKHTMANAIMTLNLLAGWTVIGWVLASIWAFTESNNY